MTGSRRVVLTGVGALTGAVTGGAAAVVDRLGRASARDRLPPLAAGALAGLVDEGEARRLSRVCQLTVAAARLALADAGLEADELGLVVGTEFGDLRSTVEFVDGYLARGPAGLSPLLFPGTVMNTMAAAAAIAVRARGLSLTLNAPTVAGELALARAAAAMQSGRADAVLAGGVDELAPVLTETLGALRAGGRRDEGAGFAVLETEEAARARGAHVLGAIAGAAWRALPAPPHGVGRGARASAVGAALAAAGLDPAALGWVLTSASGDARRDAWEAAVLDAALGAHRPPRTPLAALAGRHSGAAALGLALGATRARAEGPGLLHALARGGTHVALVVEAA